MNPRQLTSPSLSLSKYKHNVLWTNTGWTPGLHVCSYTDHCHVMMAIVHVCSRFLFDLALNDTSPSERTLRGWIQKISEVLKVSIKYTERLGEVLVNRSRYLIRRMKELKGGDSRQRFFCKTWALQLQPQELDTFENRSATAELESTVNSLEAKKKTMVKEILTLCSQLKEVNGHETRKRHKPIEELQCYRARE